MQESCTADGCVFLISHSDRDTPFLIVADRSGTTRRVDLAVPETEPALAHPGGIQLHGDVLVVPLTDYGAGLTDAAGTCAPAEGVAPCRSMVRFYRWNGTDAVPLVELDLPLGDCHEGEPVDAQSAAFVGEIGAGMVVAVQTTTTTVRFYRRHGGEWEQLPPFVVPGFWSRDCRSPSEWCRPSTMMLVQRAELMLYTFSGAGQIGRVHGYEVRFGPDRTDLLLRASQWYRSPPGVAMVASGGGRVAGETYTLFATSEHLYGPPGCFVEEWPAIGVFTPSLVPSFGHGEAAGR